MRAAILFCLLASGCGASWTTSASKALNATALAVEPIQVASLKACQSKFEQIERRAGTIPEQDAADSAKAQKVCGDVFAALEAVVAAHGAATSALIAYEASGDEVDEAKAMAALRSLTQAWEAAKKVIQEL